MKCSKQILLFASLLAPSLFAGPAHAQSSDAYLRVVDVGNGLCVIARTPDGHSMVYDTGNWQYPGRARGNGYCIEAVREIVAEPRIDLVVLSHSDGDHIGELGDILMIRSVGTILHSGDMHDPLGSLITNTRSAIAHSGAVVHNLRSLQGEWQPGKPLPYASLDPIRIQQLGAARAVLLSGWGDARWTVGPQDEPLGSAQYKGERNNAVSLVVRFEYGGHSVLLTGDTVGRHLRDPVGACKYGEREMVAQDSRFPLKSDVLIGQHHGADNGTSRCFINAVRPRYVIFSAGHKGYRHPRNATVRRLLTAPLTPKLQPDDIFRTDRADNEPGNNATPWRDREWIYGSIKGCEDAPGDDDVEIWLPADPSRPVRVEYRTHKQGC